MLVQGMMANRYMATFRDAVIGWNRKLMAVADVVSLLAEIQRTWAYLESLFIASEEVKRELPEATKRFAAIDADVKSVLAEFWRTQNCIACCGRDGLLKFLEKQQAELEVRGNLATHVLNCATLIRPMLTCASDSTHTHTDPTFVCIMSARQMCEKALADYMESKRRAFPRFYFVSTADLLDILSNGNNPIKARLAKCFSCGSGA